MKGSKTLLLTGAVASVGVAGIVGTSMVSAESTGMQTSIADKIATKFQLKSSDVRAVFDEERTARQAEHTAEVSKRLQTLVDSGKLTADQKKLIEAKMAEQQTTREAERAALQKWADDNNIDMRYVMGGRHGESNRMNDSVANSDITAEQKKLIEAKRAELEAAHEKRKTALETWAKDNGISTDYLGEPGGRGRGMGGSGGMGMGMRED